MNSSSSNEQQPMPAVLNGEQHLDDQQHLPNYNDCFPEQEEVEGQTSEHKLIFNGQFNEQQLDNDEQQSPLQRLEQLAGQLEASSKVNVISTQAIVENQPPIDVNNIQR